MRPAAERCAHGPEDFHGSLWCHMRFFRREFIIEAYPQLGEPWKKLLQVVKSNVPVCGECGQIRPWSGESHFCSNCGQPLPPPLPRNWLKSMFSKGNFEFEGYVSPKEFNITRIISYRNACIPVIRGRFEPTPIGTRIAIDMRMSGTCYLFLIGGATVKFIVLSVVAVSAASPLAALASLGRAVLFLSCKLGRIFWGSRHRSCRAEPDLAPSSRGNTGGLTPLSSRTV